MTNSRPPAARPDGRRDPLDLLWAALTSGAAAWVLMALVALFLTLAAIIPQLPIALRSDPASAARWVAERVALFGAAGPALRWLGLFDALSTIGFRLLLAVFGVVLLLQVDRGIRRAAGLTRGAALPWARRPIRRESVEAPPESLAERIEASLSSQRYATRRVEGADALTLVARRRAWAAWLAPAAHAGLLLALVSLLLTARLGWRVEGLALSEGDASSLDRRPGWAVQVDQVAPLGAAGGHAAISLLGPDGAKAASATVSEGHPMLARGLSVHLTGWGPTLEVTSVGDGGDPPRFQMPDGQSTSRVRVAFSASETERYFAVVDRNLSFRVVYFSVLPGVSPQSAGYLVQVYSGAAVEPSFSELVSEEREVRIGPDGFRLLPVRHAILAVVGDPGAVALWIGMVLAALGLGASLVRRPEWAVVRLDAEGSLTLVEWMATGGADRAVEAAVGGEGAL